MAKYIDGKELETVLTAYCEKYHDAVKNGEPEPRIPEKLGKMYLDIATNFARTREYMNVADREAMIGAGVINMLKYIHRSYKPDAPGTALSYCTFAAQSGFRRASKKERTRKDRDGELFSMFNCGQYGSSYSTMEVDRLEEYNLFSDFNPNDSDV